MKKWLFPLTFAVLLAFPAAGLAAENDHHQMPNMSPQDHQNMQMDSHTGSHESGQGTHGSSANEHGHGKPVVETPPNFKVLSAFAVINAGFLLIGIWNKVKFRRKAV